LRLFQKILKIAHKNKYFWVHINRLGVKINIQALLKTINKITDIDLIEIDLVIEAQSIKQQNGHLCKTKPVQNFPHTNEMIFIFFKNLVIMKEIIR